MLADGDRVLCAVSGGVDSLMLLSLLAAQARVYRPAIEVAAAHVVMDNVPYVTDTRWLAGYCQELGVELHTLHAAFSTEPVEAGTAAARRRKTPCFLCSWTRRKALFRFAQEHGYNKLALGHHQDDALRTLLMNLTFEGSASTLRPAMAMRHYALTVIRPLILAPERLVKAVAEGYRFPPQTVRCPYETTTNRERMAQVLATLEGLNPEARASLWRAVKC